MMKNDALRKLRDAVNEFPIHELRRLVSYDPDTGHLTWIERMSNRVKPGMPALAARKGSGHLHGFVRGVALQAHRVAWALYYGHWPVGDLDHKNGNRADNRIRNLRTVNDAINAMNRRPNAGKRSGLPHGVSQKDNGRFFAQIQKGRKNHHLGYFDTPEDAHAAYVEASQALGFHENHGKHVLDALIAQQDATNPEPSEVTHD